jgi:D-lactate dehydrogenase
LQGFDLSGKTIGVIGTGKIGKNVIKIARGFDMKVVAYDLYPDTEFAKTHNFSYLTLEELLSHSDVVTMHAPYTKENHHMINKDNISLFKKGAYFINTARGDLVDTKALQFGLENAILSGVGLDVLDGERNIKKGDKIPLLGMSGVLMTPHTAFNTYEAEMRILETTVQNIKSFISGTPVNLVK